MARLSTDRVTWKLDDTNWDLVFVNRQIAWVVGSEAVGQQIKFRLKTFRGEWFLNKETGFPWFQDVLGTQYDEAAQKTLFVDFVKQTAGVASVDRTTISFDAETRVMSVEYEVTTIFGDTINDTVDLGSVG